MKLEYVLWPGDDFVGLSDEFVIRGFRIRLVGCALSVECDPSQTTAAPAVANEYAKALGRHFPLFRLISLDDYRALAGRAVTIQGKTDRETSHARTRLRDARRCIVEHAHPRLSQCYDYLQLARDEQKQALFHIYKLVETIEREYGGEKEAVRAMGQDGLIKRLKRHANEHHHDQRHAPRDPGVTKLINEIALASLVEDARELVRRYEDAVSSTR